MTDPARPSHEGAMRNALLVVFLTWLTSCSSSAANPSTNDGGNTESGGDGAQPDNTITADTGTADGGRDVTTTPDGCSAFEFDASAYAADGGDAAALVGTAC